MGVLLTGRGHRQTDACLTEFVGAAMVVADALAHDGLAGAVDTAKANAALLVDHTFRRRRHTLPAHASLASRAILIALAYIGTALAIDAELSSRTLTVGITFGVWLARIKEATLPGQAIAIVGAFRCGKALTEFTDLVGRAVLIGPTLWRRDRQADPGDTFREEGTIRAGLTSAGSGARIIDASKVWQDAIAVGLTNQRRDAALTHTIPGRGAIVGTGAAGGDAIAKVAAVSKGAIRVDIAGGPRLAEKAVADRTGRALGINGALPGVHTAIAKAGKSCGAVGAAIALTLGLADLRERIALLAGRTIPIAGTASQR